MRHSQYDRGCLALAWGDRGHLASTGMTEFHAIPRPGSTPVDDLAWADGRDILLAITCKPYRSEVVEAVKIAKEQGMKIVALSDSPASPILCMADHGFVVSVETPQFFPSSVSIIALLETLLSFVIAVASDENPSGLRHFTNAATSLASIMTRTYDQPDPIIRRTLLH